MSSIASVNRHFINAVRQRTQALEHARRIYPPQYINEVYLPAHEKDLLNLLSQRNLIMSGTVRGFSASKSRPLPKVIKRGIRDVYGDQLKQIDAQYRAAAKAADKTRDRDMKRAGSNKVMRAQVTAAYNTAIKNAQDARRNAYNLLTAQMTNTQTAVAPVTTGTAGVQAPMFPDMGSYQPAPVYNYFQPAGYGPAPSAAPSAPELYSYDTVAPGDDIFDELFGWFDDFWGNPGYNDTVGDRSVPPSQVYVQDRAPQQPQYQLPVSQPPTPPGYYNQDNQLDVFAPDAWGFGSNSMLGSNTIRKINSLPVIPARAMGFGQWAQVASAVIQAGAQIGASAIQKPSTPKPAKQPIVAPTMSPAPVSQSHTGMYLAGAAGIAGLIGLALLLRRK